MPLRRSRHRVHRAGARRRAFALPLVLLLAFVIALTGGIILQLQSDAALTVTRHARVYRDHHLSAGIREIINQWLLTGGNDIPSRLEDDGLAFELELPQGHRILVYLADAQGAVLTDLSALDGPRAAAAQRLVEALAVASERPGRSAHPRAHAPESLFRTVGPVQISVNSAPEAVLNAIADVNETPDRARSVIRNILSRRQRGQKLTREDLASIIATATLAPGAARQLNDLLTTEPVLWRMTIETRAGTYSTARPERTIALVQTPPPGQNFHASGIVVLSWEDDTQGPDR